jgi:hypothetical protein
MRRFFALVLAAALCACREHREARVTSPQPVKAVNTSNASEEWDSLPSRDEYAGSAVCGECHEKNHEAWTHDWHARALSEANARTVEGSFRNAHYKGKSSEARMTRHGEKYVMRTRDRSGALRDFPVSWVIGGKRMQDTVTVFDDGRWQVLPIYFHVTGRGEWVDYNEAKQGVVTPDHPYFWTNFKRTANKECLDCHSTGLDVRYDAATQEWRTSFADAGVACEACHGPGARHAETKSKSDIIHPGHIDKSLALAICGRCHGPREPLYPLLDIKHQFKPGQRYADKFQPLVIVDGVQRSGEYFADGRPSSSSFEYQALLQSRCFMSGGATCLTCHTAPHKPHGPNEVKGGVDDSCRSCHASVVAAGVAHTHHKSATCTDCHMPRLLSGVLDKFPDHTIDIPNPANTMRHAAPNACGVCHHDKSNDELVRVVASWWPQAAARQARRGRLADAVDEKTATASLPFLDAVIRDVSEAPTLRGAAADLLGQRFPREASAILVSQLHDRDELVRSRVVEALGYANARESSNDVATLLDDPSTEVRQTAALVLASFNDLRAEAALRKLATDPATHTLVRPHISLAISAAKRGDFDGARKEIDAALAEAPYVTDALVFRADLFARRGDLAGAKASLEEALRFDPSHKGAIARLGAMR